MKMRITDKLLLALSGLLILLGGGAIAAMGFGVLPYSLELAAKSGETAMEISWIMVAAGAFMILWGLYIFCVPCRMRYNRHNFVVQKTESGELRIAIKAIESLVKRCVNMHDEIHLVSMHIYSRKSTVVIAMRISLSNNVSIPLAVASLQKQIKQYLLASSGIEINDISVTVDTTSDAKHDSPYTVNAAIPAAQEPAAEKPEQKPAKKPLHQRLFSSKNENEKAKPEEKPEVKTEENEPTIPEMKNEEMQPDEENPQQENSSAAEPQKEITVNE